MLGDRSAERLRSAPLAWLTTVRADGQPQTSYVWFHFDGDDVVVLSEPNAGKVRNLAGNPKVSLHLDGDVVTGGGVLTIDAVAELIAELPGERRRAYVAKYENRIASGPWRTPDVFIATFSTAIRVSPGRVRAW